MGRGSSLGSDHCLTFSVLMLNVTIGLLGLTLFCLSVWMRFEGEVRVWISELGMYQYWTGLYILMAASIIIVLISICGCGGTLTANPALLGANLSLTSFTFVLFILGASVLLGKYVQPTMDMEYLEEQFTNIFSMKNHRSDEFLIFLYWKSALLVLIALILELAGGIYMVVHGTENSQLTPWLEGKFNRLIIDSNYNDRALNILQTVQEKVGCCGALSYQDYDRNRLPISDFCRDKISGNVFQDGCVKRFSIFIEKRSGWLSGIALFIAFLQIILVGLTFWHWKRVREVDEEDYPRKGYYDPVPTKTR
ncbi:23 kDa integral membrane protein [Orchesella cincta]|uniref:23 kDa integral membrane protein n=1 Tax=Orchesella cincta TaxID=48709 RepID=A0A1D2N1L8_ORCCI|nr:23 kDa integral membrane protein [Orchesella cincta]